MGRSLFGLLLLAALLTSITSATDADVESIKKDRQRIAGKWQVVALEINGDETSLENANKLTVVNRPDGTWSVRSEGREVSKGTSVIDPTKKPRTIDFTPTEGGGKGNKHLGIYELKTETRRLCFAQPGSQRPTKFSSDSENQQILVTFKRIKAE